MSYRKSIATLTLTLALVLAPPIAALPASAAAGNDRPAAASEGALASSSLAGRVLDLWSALRLYLSQPRSERVGVAGASSAAPAGGNEQVQGGWDPSGVSDPPPPQSPEPQSTPSGDGGDG